MQTPDLLYDKEGFISNPHGLVNDLQKKSDEQLRMSVFITPQ